MVIGLLVGMSFCSYWLEVRWRTDQHVDSRKIRPRVHVAKETKYFHLLNISNMTFDEYTVKMKDWPSLAGDLESLDVSET